MRIHFMSSILAGLCVLVLPAVLLAQSAAPAQDLSGVWSPRPRARTLNANPVELMRPWAAQEHQRVRAGLTNPDEQALDRLDPAQACFPYGPSRQLTLNRPFEIVQIPGRVIILYESLHEVRHVWTDGRTHNQGLQPSWLGHSVGRWDGNTFVVDTVGFRQDTWLDGDGTPHSEALRFVERFRRTNPTTLELDFTVDDPEAYTKSWGGKHTYELKPDWQIMEHLNCEDYLRERVQEIMKKTR